MRKMALDFAWLGQGLAVDLVNTRVPAQGADLLSDWPGLEQWGISPEKAQSPRDTATRALNHLIAGELFSGEVCLAINEASLADPERVTLTPQHERISRSGFAGAVARDLIRLASERIELRLCAAPGCGMVYIRTRTTQEWCSRSCGNRARVARHALRAASTR